MALTPDQRRRLDRLLRLQSEAHALGLAVTATCARCNAPLTAPRSLDAALGPTCRRHEKSDGPGQPTKSTGTAAHRSPTA